MSIRTQSKVDVGWSEGAPKVSMMLRQEWFALASKTTDTKVTVYTTLGGHPTVLLIAEIGEARYGAKIPMADLVGAIFNDLIDQVEAQDGTTQNQDDQTKD